MANVQPWFRMYRQAADDPQIIMHPEHIQARWWRLLCYADETTGALPDIRTLAFRLRLSEAEVAETLRILGPLPGGNPGLFEERSGQWFARNWEHWQRRSDNSAERVRRHRAKAHAEASCNEPSNVTRNVTETNERNGQTEETEETDRQNPPLPPRADFGEQDAYEWFVANFRGEIPQNTWQAFPAAVGTPERLNALRAHLAGWMATPKYRDGFGKDAIGFLRSGIWLSPAPVIPPRGEERRQGVESSAAAAVKMARERKGRAA